MEAASRSAPPPPPHSLLAQLLQRALYVPEKVDVADLWGRAAVWLLLLGWTGVFLRLPYRGTAINASFLHHVNLAFHEAGHVLFMPFGTFMRILGGSLLQCLWPLILCAAFVWRYRNPFGGAACLWWCGQAVLDLAPYIADARIMDNPLVGESSDEDADLRPERHDWHRLLQMLGLLKRDLVLGRGAYWIGVMIMSLALLWGAYLLYQQRRRLAPGYLHDE